MPAIITISFIYILILRLGSLKASTIDEPGHGFCYREWEHCGPSSKAWASLCHSGHHQSPIILPNMEPQGSITLNLSIYKGNSFRLQNNGHSVQFNFGKEFPANHILTFPIPTTSQDSPSFEQREYKFASGHFHWGVNDHATGSEHCLESKCTAMELHLVHYLANYGTVSDALLSGDENALCVIGVLINVDPLESASGPIPNFPLSPLAPIVRNLNRVQLATNDSSVWTVVNETLDLGIFLTEALPEVYIYKGSLTTPGCNEQVNWFVFKQPAEASHQELQAFRILVKDEGMETLTENHRPIQAINHRNVFLYEVNVSSSAAILHLKFYPSLFSLLLFLRVHF